MFRSRLPVSLTKINVQQLQNAHEFLSFDLFLGGISGIYLKWDVGPLKWQSDL